MPGKPVYLHLSDVIDSGIYCEFLTLAKIPAGRRAGRYSPTAVLELIWAFHNAVAVLFRKPELPAGILWPFSLKLLLLSRVCLKNWQCFVCSLSEGCALKQPHKNTVFLSVFSFFPF